MLLALALRLRLLLPLLALPLCKSKEERSYFKDGAYFCYCAYVLRILRYSGFLRVVPANTGIFLGDLKLRRESRTLQVLLVSKKKIGGSHAFFSDSKASIWKKNAIHCFVFYCFIELLLLNYL